MTEQKTETLPPSIQEVGDKIASLEFTDRNQLNKAIDRLAPELGNIAGDVLSDVLTGKVKMKNLFGTIMGRVGDVLEKQPLPTKEEIKKLKG